ncbi:MAG: hypothetical protein FJ125_18025, partial [Deltaproteobacteria bacterium]|nr:hypothetical protein [Deltaproteobacteria bacterium]
MAEPTPPAGSLLPLPAGIWRLVGEHPWTPAEVGRGLRRICVAAGTLAAGASGPAAAEALQADGA